MYSNDLDFLRYWELLKLVQKRVPYLNLNIRCKHDQEVLKRKAYQLGILKEIG